VVLWRSATYLSERVVLPHPMTPYVAPQYWLSYGDGFLRRALPGQLLHWIGRGEEPSYRLVKLAGVGMTGLAVLAVLVLAVALARRAADGWGAVGVAAAVVVSPVTLSLYPRDLGRPDAIGAVVLVALACLPWRRLPRPMALGSVIVLTVAAVATMEFLVLVVVPMAWLVIRSLLPEGRSRTTVVATLGPAVAVAVLSAVIDAPEAVLTRATAAAAAAGVPPRSALVVDHDSVSRLRHGFVDNVSTYYALTDAPTVLVMSLVWGAAFLLTTGLVWYLLGGGLTERPFLRVVAAASAVAVLLSLAGIDHRRWWTLATVAALAALVHLRPERAVRPAPALGLVRVAAPIAAAVLLAAAGLLLQSEPIYHLRLF
jgi:hypothetical protein